VRLVLIAALAAAGCFAPEYSSGGLLCDTNGGHCPSGYHCASDRTCWRDGSDPDLAEGLTPDLATDAGLADLARPDLATPDLARSGDGGLVLSGTLEPAGPVGATVSNLRLVEGSLESFTTCNQSLCLTGGVVP
jgi:hypothetical protein